MENDDTDPINLAHTVGRHEDDLDRISKDAEKFKTETAKQIGDLQSELKELKDTCRLLMWTLDAVRVFALHVDADDHERARESDRKYLSQFEDLKKRLRQ